MRTVDLFPVYPAPGQRMAFLRSTTIPLILSSWVNICFTKNIGKQSPGILGGDRSWISQTGDAQPSLG